MHAAVRLSQRLDDVLPMCCQVLLAPNQVVDSGCCLRSCSLPALDILYKHHDAAAAAVHLLAENWTDTILLYAMVDQL